MVSIEARHFQLGMWGSFGINNDLPKQEVSELTMEVILMNDHEMEVSAKLLCY